MNMRDADRLALRALRTIQKGEKFYQVQWLHNHQWRIEEDGSGNFKTRDAAEEAAKSPAYKNVQTRIVEVQP